MRIFLVLAISILAVMSVACGDDDKASPTAAATTAATVSANTPVASPVQTQTANTPASGAATTAAPTSAPAGATVEVTGIVGGVNLNGSILEIKRLQGAAVTQVSADSRTVIRKAAGGTVAFANIRTSDRIIAKGTLNDRRDTLLATEITVQDVIPGAQPGG